MNKVIGKTKLQNYLRRWAIVNAVEIQELRKTAISEKVRQFLTLAASIFIFGSYAKKHADSRMVQKRWQLIRRKLGHAG